MESGLNNPMLVILLAALASYVSRGLGALLSGRINAEGPMVEWITCITYALMAGLVVRMLLLPIGALVGTPDWMRLAAIATGLIIFFTTRKNIGFGVFGGSAMLAWLAWTY